MVAAETSTSSLNGMGEEPPLRIRLQRTFNLARMSLVSPWRVKAHLLRELPFCDLKLTVALLKSDHERFLAAVIAGE
jgi:hypothetical protein